MLYMFKRWLPEKICLSEGDIDNFSLRTSFYPVNISSVAGNSKGAYRIKKYICIWIKFYHDY